MNLRENARGRPCLIRSPFCNGNRETTVLCHITTEFSGIALKSPDICAVWGCSDCHDFVDGRRPGCTRDDYNELMLSALCRQMAFYLNDGTLIIGEKNGR